MNHIKYILAYPFSWFWDNKFPLLQSLFWILLILFFSYTTIFYEFSLVKGNPLKEFHEALQTTVTLFVNIGIILFVLLDVWFSEISISKRVNILTSIALFICVGMMIHSGMVIDDSYKHHLNPLGWEYFSVFLFSLFVLIATILKFHVLIRGTQVDKEL